MQSEVRALGLASRPPGCPGAMGNVCVCQLDRSRCGANQLLETFGGGSATSCERFWRAPAAVARGESPRSQRLAVCGTLLLHLRDAAKMEGLEVGGKTESREERWTRLELSLMSPLQQT